MAAARTALLWLMLACAWQPTFSITATLTWNKTCPAWTSLAGKPFKTRYYDAGCVLAPIPNVTRGNVTDINIVVLNPYSSAVGDTMTALEPMYAAAVQEIEDSGLLPGYRLKLHLYDSLCTAQDAVAQTSKAFEEGVPKHGLIGDACADSAQAANDILQIYNVLQITPYNSDNSLEDHGRYPNMIRTSPSYSFSSFAMWVLVKLLGWKRVMLIFEPQGAYLDVVMFLSGVMTNDAQMEMASGKMPVAVLPTGGIMITGAADFGPAVAKLKQLDAHVVIADVSPISLTVLLCQAGGNGMVAPNMIWLYPTGYLPPFFLNIYVPFLGGMCDPVKATAAAFGMIQATRSFNSMDSTVHGLSGRKLSDITGQYYYGCMTFGGNGGFCQQDAGYNYDAVWEFAWVLDAYFKSGQNLTGLKTAAGRQWLFNKALTADFQGVSGRVQHYSGPKTASPWPFDPTKEAFGERASGEISIYQQTGPASDALRAKWTLTMTPAGWYQFVSPFVWSPTDPSKNVTCAMMSCTSGWVPPDRNLSCSAGSTWDLMNGCTKCPQGRAAKLGAAICDPCAVGSYAGTTGQSTCDACPAGKYGKDPAAVQCTDCMQGSYTDKTGLTLCSLCATGTYADVQGSLNCTVCPAGETTGAVGRISHDDCVCQENAFRDDSGACVDCLEGMTCAVGSDAALIPNRLNTIPLRGGLAYPALLPGFWSSRSDPLSIYRCLPESRCPGDAPEECGDNLQDPSCAHCAPGYFYSSGKCKVCTNSDNSKGIFPILPIILVIVVIVILYILFSDPETHWDSWKNCCTTLLFITWNHYQTLVLVRMTNTQIPQSVSSVFSIWSWTNDVLSVFQLECVGVREFSSRLGLQTVMPLALAVLTVATFLGSQLLAVVTCRKWLALDHNRLFNVFLSIIFTFFLGIVAISLTLFRCVNNPSGKMTLSGDMSVICYEDEWKGMLVMDILAVIVYCLGFICLIGRAIYVAKYHWESPQFQERWKFMFSKYRSDVHWWGLVFVLRVSLLNVGLTFFTYGVQQLYWIMTVTVFYAGAEVMFQPWRHRLSNMVEIIADVCIAYVCSMTAWLAPREDFLTTALSNAGIAVSFMPLSAGILLAVYIFRRSKLQPAAEQQERAVALLQAVEAAKALSEASEEETKAFFQRVGPVHRWQLEQFSHVLQWELLGERTNRSRITPNGGVLGAIRRSRASEGPQHVEEDEKKPEPVAQQPEDASCTFTAVQATV